MRSRSTTSWTTLELPSSSRITRQRLRARAFSRCIVPRTAVRFMWYAVSREARRSPAVLVTVSARPRSLDGRLHEEATVKRRRTELIREGRHAAEVDIEIEYDEE